ncbi:tRNA_anti-like [Lachnospiraceae bacterium XBB2008]|nr:tRNA_anti-like [Lachnospiraceae bacterium XBB2008]
MDFLFALLFVIGFFVFLINTIIFLVKKARYVDSKKNAYILFISLGISFFSLIIFISLISKDSDNKKEDTSTVQNVPVTTVQENQSQITGDSYDDTFTQDLSAEIQRDEPAEVLPFPDNSEIYFVADYSKFYKNFSDGDLNKWYQMTVPVYSVNETGVIIHDDLNKTLGLIGVTFADPSDVNRVHRGDNITIVGYIDFKLASGILMDSAYLLGIQETANTIYDDQVIIVNDYVYFAENYDSHDIGKTVQITGKVASYGSDHFEIKEGFTKGEIQGYLADDETFDGINIGDTVTFVGVASSKLWDAVTINDVHFGATNVTNTVNYEETEAYYNKQLPKEYMITSVSEMYMDMDSNAMNAKEKYDDQDVQVSGIITRIDDKGKNLYIGSSVGSDDIYCSIENEEQRDVLRQLSVGSSVTIKGYCYQASQTWGYGIRIEELLPY